MTAVRWGRARRRRGLHAGTVDGKCMQFAPSEYSGFTVSVLLFYNVQFINDVLSSGKLFDDEQGVADIDTSGAL